MSVNYSDIVLFVHMFICGLFLHGMTQNDTLEIMVTATQDAQARGILKIVPVFSNYNYALLAVN